MHDNPLVKMSGDNVVLTKEGRERLLGMVTTATADVYAFRPGTNPVYAAAAMARLSRSPTDLRAIIAGEFLVEPSDQKSADSLLERVISNYGDDSVQQLVGCHVVVEGASNLLTKLLEWPRFLAYLEQSTRYIFFDRRDADGKFRYFIPEGLSPQLREQYVRVMDGIFERYSQMVRELTEYVRSHNPPTEKLKGEAWQAATRAQACDAIRPVLPAATRSTVGIFGSAQGLDSLMMFLMSQELPEARAAGQAIYDQLIQVAPTFFQRTMKADRGLATVAYRAQTRAGLANLASHLLTPVEQVEEPAGVQLVSHWPQQEADIAGEMLFAVSNLPLAEIKRQVAAMTRDEVGQIFAAAMGERLNRRHKPGRALELPHYQFAVTGDYGTFRDLQRHRVIDGLEWQRLTPSLGFDVPALVQEAGLEELFRSCFGLSDQLHAALLQAGLQAEAQYATLLGHRMRYTFTLNARAAFHFLELRSSPQGHPGYRKIAQQMHALIAGVHPTIAAAMQFVNQKDMLEELTRAAEASGAAYKQAQLEGQE